MTSAGLRAATQTAQMAKAAANPYVMVKHGRREDRAAAYDRFIAACAASYHNGEMDEGGVTELLAALQAIQLRAPRHVRRAANELFGRIAGPLGFTKGGQWEIVGTEEFIPPADDEEAPENESGRVTPMSGTKGSWWRGVPRRNAAARPVWPEPIRSSDGLLMALGNFTTIARLDVLGRWWHNLLTPPGKRWWLGRK